MAGRPYGSLADFWHRAGGVPPGRRAAGARRRLRRALRLGRWSTGPSGRPRPADPPRPAAAGRRAGPVVPGGGPRCPRGHPVPRTTERAGPATEREAQVALAATSGESLTTVQRPDVRALAARQSQAARPVVAAPVQLALDLGDAPGVGRAQRAAGDDRRPSGSGPSSRCSGSTRAGTSSTSTSRSCAALGVTRAPDLLRCRSQAEVLVAGVKVATQTPPIRSGRRVVFVTLDDATRSDRRDLLRGRPGSLRRDAVPLVAARHPRPRPAHRSARGVDAGHRLLGAARAARRLAGRRPGRGRRGDGRQRAGHRPLGGRGGREPLDPAGDDPARRSVAPRRPTSRARSGRPGRPAAWGGRAGCWCTRAGSASRRTPTSSRPASPATTPGRRPARRRRRRRASCGTPARAARADD